MNRSNISVGDIVEVKVKAIAPFGLIVSFSKGDETREGAIDNTDIPKGFPSIHFDNTLHAVIISVDDPRRNKLSLLPRFYYLRDQWETYKRSLNIGDVFELSTAVCTTSDKNCIVVMMVGYPDWAELNSSLNIERLQILKRKIEKGERLYAKIVGFNDTTCRPIVAMIDPEDTVERNESEV